MFSAEAARCDSLFGGFVNLFSGEVREHEWLDEQGETSTWRAFLIPAAIVNDVGAHRSSAA